MRQRANVALRSELNVFGSRFRFGTKGVFGLRAKLILEAVCEYQHKTESEFGLA